MTDEDNIKELFPNLKKKGAGLQMTSPIDPFYNCIAWAADRTDQVWWPEGGYWPPGAPRTNTISSFLAAFKTLGYSECDNSELEAGFDKIALYAKRGEPTHMAKQLPSGDWTSKLGRLNDISHSGVPGVSGTAYGTVVTFLSRKQ